MNREIERDFVENEILPLPRVAELSNISIPSLRRAGCLPFELSNDRILPLPLMAELASISVATLRRLIDRKQGPRLTRLSARRIGIRMSHAREWLEGRAQRAG